MNLDKLPRMADFARVLTAVDRVLGTDGMTTYGKLANELAADLVAADPVLAALTKYVTEPWEGTATELLAKLEDRSDMGGAWPRSAKAMTALLRRRAPSLRRTGWVVTDLGRGGKDHVKRFRLEPPAGDA